MKPRKPPITALLLIALSCASAPGCFIAEWFSREPEQELPERTMSARRARAILARARQHLHGQRTPSHEFVIRETERVTRKSKDPQCQWEALLIQALAYQGKAAVHQAEAAACRAKAGDYQAKATACQAETARYLAKAASAANDAARAQATAKAVTAAKAKEAERAKEAAQLRQARACQERADAAARAAPGAAYRAIEILLGNLKDPSERRSDRAVTTLKTLLMVYVETAVLAKGSEDALTCLKRWEGDVRGRFEASPHPDPLAAKAMTDVFALLKEMAEQHMASREPQRKVQTVIQQYVHLFNARDAKGLIGLLAPDSDLARLTRAKGVRALAGKAVAGLDLASAIKISITYGLGADGKKQPVSAAAACDLLVTSPTGWARVAPQVCFNLARDGNGDWLIRSILRHP